MSGPGIGSYSSTKIGLRGRLSEARHLYRRQTKNIPAQVSVLVDRLRTTERAIEEQTGLRAEGLKILEIGPGQKQRQMRYFAAKNEVVGIDLDEIVQGWDVLGYSRMLRKNGLTRVAKTLGRKALGLDRRFNAELRRQMGARGPNRPLQILQMDATAMRFPAESFDLVYSYSVFEHLPEPGKVLDGIKKVLRPGGCVYISLHLFTADNGSHDPRLFSGNRDSLPYWAHLRPGHAHEAHPNAYLNRLRLSQWDDLFRERLAGVHLQRLQYANEVLMPKLAALRESGELKDYSDEELLTIDYVAIWKKPARSDG